MNTQPVTPRLDQIDHIVVLMLENRSFDHMLGYLSLEGGRTDIDGLKPGMSNTHNNANYPIHHLTRTAFTPDEDPDHSGAATTLQIAGGAMSGFVAAFDAILTRRNAPTTISRDLVMGYYNAGDLPVYDHLAAEFCVCDHWHSSVPGATWPNRLYALTGRADGTRDDRPPPPLYDIPSFVRHLDANGISWRWYSYDPGTLRCVDRHYWLNHWDNFRFVDKTKLNWAGAVKGVPVIDETSSSFLEDATNGKLPHVSWIDPNFKDFNIYGGDSNDDHPPSDIRNGQALVLAVYDALASSQKWENTLLVITYDEHGGFSDHVPPPAAQDDDPRTFGQYGIRVPAIIVSPYVRRGSVSHTLFDHTSIIKTILLRFCPNALQPRRGLTALLDRLIPGRPHEPGKRIATANDLSPLLTEPSPRQPPTRTPLLQDESARRATNAAAAAAAAPTDSRVTAMTDLQTGIATAARGLRRKGLPPIQP